LFTISTLIVLPSVAGFLVGSPPPPVPAEELPDGAETAGPELAPPVAAPELAAEGELPTDAEPAAEGAELAPPAAAEVADGVDAAVPVELLHAAVTSIAAQLTAIAAPCLSSASGVIPFGR